MSFKLVVIGASKGSLQALEILLKSLPAIFPAAIAIVLHREKDSGDTLRHLIQKYTSLEVIEPEDKEPILPGHVYIAPPDYHLLVEEEHFALSTESPVYYARPSIDLLFETAADAYGEEVIGVLLTGASEDGAKGLGAIKQNGGLTVVQDPKTAEAPVMPEAAIAAGPVDRIMSLERIGPFLIDCRKKRTITKWL